MIEEKLDKMENLPAGRVQILRQIYLEFIEAFGIEQSMCKMSNLTPLEVEVLPEAHGLQCKWRSLGPEQRAFLKKKLDSICTLPAGRFSILSSFSSITFVISSCSLGHSSVPSP